MDRSRYWTFALPIVACAWIGPAAAQDGSGNNVELFMTSSSPMAISYIFSVTAMKICAFVIGYLIVKLGHDTLIKGVSGDIDFGFSGSGIETKLKAASPGTFFVLAGAAIILWGLFVERPITLSMTQSGSESTAAVEDQQQRRAPDNGGSDDGPIQLVRPPLE